ncbi:MAG: hypothetical protein L6R37_002950 [Teloschistes peruensis]|nr:MAG: hypothetical protein L6R37_002950 [Teloschistes peruensis]
MELRTEVPEADAVLIDTAIIPGTGFLVSSNNARDTGPLESRIGQVTNHVALENYIVFTTHLNKVFLYCCDFPLPEIDPPEPIELTAFYPEAPSDQPFEIRDLQGSFRSFAIFLSSGEVLMGSRAMLDAFHSGTYNPNVTEENPTPESHPRIIPDLQYNSIISIAFGDHHFQALRSDGTIYAYGNDPKSCGALGLGFPEGTGPLRGLLTNHFSRDGTPGENIGRQVWFDPTMHAWIGEMKEKAGMEDEAAARGQMILPARGRRQYAPAVKAVGDWFEKEGRRWEDGVVAEEGGMGGYFVLKVAAAGWHSAALVLVDEEIVERARVMHVVAPPEAEAGGKGEVEGEKEGEDDWHGGTWEDIDAPWEQLSKAVVAIGGWMWGLGRRFLGLVERDERDSAEEGEKRAKEEEQKEQKEEVKWTWSEQPFPRLRMADGKVMPGETAVIE